MNTIENRLTIIMYTSCCSGTNNNPQLIEYIFNNFKMCTSIKKCPCLMAFDSTLDITGEFEKHLRFFCENNSIEFVKSKDGGLALSVKKALPLVNTEFYYPMEHDWILLKKINIGKILDVMTEFDFINYIRFNFRKSGFDRQGKKELHVSKETRIKAIPLLKFPGWSNPTHIARTSFFLSNLYSLIEINPNKAMGIEESIKQKYLIDIQEYGFDKVHDKWGTYIYGKLGQPALTKHLNARANELSKFKPNDIVKIKYNSYDDYLSHQREKSSDPKRRQYWIEKEWDMKIEKFEKAFSRHFSKIIKRKRTKALCICARMGQEVQAFINLGAQAIGIDLVPCEPLVIEGDMHNLHFENDSFDIVFSNSFDHSIYPQKFISEIERVVKYEGFLLLHLQKGKPAHNWDINEVHRIKDVTDLFVDLKFIKKCTCACLNANLEILAQKVK